MEIADFLELPDNDIRLKKLEVEEVTVIALSEFTNP
jgi:hypothetical protein